VALAHSVGSDAINVVVPAEAPRLVFFGDRYAPGWRAQWNGQALPVLRANAVFMAVAVPAGAGTLELRFEPPNFYNAVRVAAAAALLWFGLALLAIVLFLLKRRKKRDALASPRDELDLARPGPEPEPVKRQQT
jgi:LPXTG-motif cell wall-anchored protein